MVMMLDGPLQNDVTGRGSDRQLNLFCEIGTLIKTMLTPPCNKNISDAATKDLLVHLGEIRDGIMQDSVQVSSGASTQCQLFCGRGGKMCIPSSNNCSLLFFQLVEHLVIRTLWLYYMWGPSNG